jgi:hypothetical protein
MNEQAPIFVTIVASFYLMVCTVGFAVHDREIVARPAFQHDDALIELTEVIVWIAVHAAFSFFDSLQKGRFTFCSWS